MSQSLDHQVDAECLTLVLSLSTTIASNAITANTNKRIRERKTIGFFSIKNVKLPQDFATSCSNDPQCNKSNVHNGLLAIPPLTFELFYEASI